MSTENNTPIVVHGDDLVFDWHGRQVHIPWGLYRRIQHQCACECYKLATTADEAWKVAGRIRERFGFNPRHCYETWGGKG